MIKFFKKYRIYFVIFVLVFVMLSVVFSLKTFLYPDDLSSIYGNRLKGIEEVSINSDRKLSVVSLIKTNKEVDTSTIDIRGKIINIIIKGHDDLTVEKAQNILNEILAKFSKKEINYYDFQFFVTNDVLNYTLLGYKNKTTENTVWTQTSEVKKNEEEKE